jgi:hypothetical protein
MSKAIYMNWRRFLQFTGAAVFAAASFPRFLSAESSRAPDEIIKLNTLQYIQFDNGHDEQMMHVLHSWFCRGRRSRCSSASTTRACTCTTATTSNMRIWA